MSKSEFNLGAEISQKSDHQKEPKSSKIKISIITYRDQKIDVTQKSYLKYPFKRKWFLISYSKNLNFISSIHLNLIFLLNKLILIIELFDYLKNLFLKWFF